MGCFTLDRSAVVLKKHAKHQKHENHTALVRRAASIYELSIICEGSVAVYSYGTDVILCSGIYQKVVDTHITICYLK